jgi:hypothetical protein
VPKTSGLSLGPVALVLLESVLMDLESESSKQLQNFFVLGLLKFASGAPKSSKQVRPDLSRNVCIDPHTPDSDCATLIISFLRKV